MRAVPLNNGKLELREIPTPVPGPGGSRDPTSAKTGITNPEAREAREFTNRARQGSNLRPTA